MEECSFQKLNLKLSVTANINFLKIHCDIYMLSLLQEMLYASPFGNKKCLS